VERVLLPAAFNPRLVLMLSETNTGVKSSGRGRQLNHSSRGTQTL
jgi:hypothetical protein